MRPKPLFHEAYVRHALRDGLYYRLKAVELYYLHIFLKVEAGLAHLRTHYHLSRLGAVDGDLLALEIFYVAVLVFILRQSDSLASLRYRPAVNHEPRALRGVGQRWNDPERQYVELAELGGAVTPSLRFEICMSLTSSPSSL